MKTIAPQQIAHFAEQESDNVQITLRLTQAQLVRLTNMAKRQGIPRASYIKRAVFIQLASDEKE